MPSAATRACRARTARSSRSSVVSRARKRTRSPRGARRTLARETRVVDPVAILVLGARVRAGGRPGPALRRRIETAARAAERFPAARLLACGGCAWDGIVEADVMARELVERGVARSSVRRDRLSFTTIENLRQ